MHCSVKSCKNGKNSNKEKGVSIHRFPQNKEKRRLWAEILDFEINKTENEIKVCSRHFRPEHIKRKLVRHRWKNFLKPEALPIPHEDIEDEAEEVHETTEPLMDCDIVKEEYEIYENSAAVERIFEDQKREKERQIIIQNVKNILEVARNSSSTNDHGVPPVTAEKELAKAYGDYVRTKFQNWDIPKQIQRFKMITDVMEQFEDI